MIDLENIPKIELIKALRKLKDVNCYTIEDKYIIEIQKEGEADGTKTN